MDIETRQPAAYARFVAPLYHVARFIMIGLYMGTRHNAILGLRWRESVGSGHIDLRHGRIYRRGSEEAETFKRRPPVPMSRRLSAHMARAKKRTTVGPVEHQGALIKKERRGFDRAALFAGLDDSVTPHVLRHTCATWALQNGASTWEVAGLLGTSENMIRRNYGHHASDYLSGAADAVSGARPRNNDVPKGSRSRK